MRNGNRMTECGELRAAASQFCRASALGEAHRSLWCSTPVGRSGYAGSAPIAAGLFRIRSFGRTGATDQAAIADTRESVSMPRCPGPAVVGDQHQADRSRAAAWVQGLGDADRQRPRVPGYRAHAHVLTVARPDELAVAAVAVPVNAVDAQWPLAAQLGDWFACLERAQNRRRLQLSVRHCAAKPQARGGRSASSAASSAGLGSARLRAS